LVRDNSLLRKVASYSARVRKLVTRTRFGAAHEVVNLINLFVSKKPSLARVSTQCWEGNFTGAPVIIDNSIPYNLYDMDKNIIALRKQACEIQTKTVRGLVSTLR
jgi:hypothetical protein